MMKANCRIKGGKLIGEKKWTDKGFVLRFFRLEANGDLVEVKEFNAVSPEEIIITT